MDHIECLTRELGAKFSDIFRSTVFPNLGVGFQMWHLDNSINVDFFGDLESSGQKQLSVVLMDCHREMKNETKIFINFFKTRLDAEKNMVRKLENTN